MPDQLIELIRGFEVQPVAFLDIALTALLIYGLLSLIRGVLSWRAPDAEGATRVPLLSGFFAALFGTAAGHWVYDHLFRAQPPANPRPESEFLRTPRPAPPEPADTDETAAL